MFKNISKNPLFAKTLQLSTLNSKFQLLILRYSLSNPYEDTVGDDLDGFIERMTEQVATLFNGKLFNIKLMDVQSGSTKITFDLVGYNEEEKKDLEKGLKDAAKLFENGEVTLVISLIRRLTHWSWEGKKSKISVSHDIHFMGKKNSLDMNTLCFKKPLFAAGFHVS